MSDRRLGFLRALFVERSPRFYRASGLEAFTISGDCLRPWLLPGDVAFVDPTLDPVAGELVLVAMKFRRTTTIGAGAIFRIEKAIKQFVAADRPMLACESGAVPADPHEIEGVVVAVSRRGWRRSPMRLLDFRRIAETQAR